MKKILVLLAMATIVIMACTNQESNAGNDELKKKREALNDLFKKYEKPSQTFEVKADKPSKITGKQGTVIYINPDDLMTESGEALGKNIEVELKELSNQDDLLNSNAQTVSNGELLISGGAYYINMRSGGQQLKLKEGKTLKVEFPKLTNDEMSLFYGQRDSLGQMNWQKGNEVFKPKSMPPASAKKDSSRISKVARLGSEMQILIDYMENEDTTANLSKEEKEKWEKIEKANQKVYSAIDLNSFGWINCDRFLDVQNKTNLNINFRSANKVVAADIYLVFKDINSIMKSWYYTFGKEVYNEGFKNIPTGYKVRLIAISIEDDKILSYASDLTVKENQTLTLDMKETSDKELKKLLGN